MTQSAEGTGASHTAAGGDRDTEAAAEEHQGRLQTGGTLPGRYAIRNV